MYDEKFASLVKRKKIEYAESASCLLCIRHANSASEYEWPCLILKDWICETHCIETQMTDYEDTRKQIVNLFGQELKLKNEQDLLKICPTCPYSEQNIKTR